MRKTVILKYFVMKKLIILILISAGFLCSCERDMTDVIPDVIPVDYLVIGDKNATIFLPGPFKTESSYSYPSSSEPWPPPPALNWTASILDLDMDNDGNHDFKIVYSLVSRLETYTKSCSIKRITDGAKILSDDSPESPWQDKYPEILEVGDTLKLTGKWRSEPFSPMNPPYSSDPQSQPPALDTSMSFHLASFFAWLCFDQNFKAYWEGSLYGNWINATNKYIGVMLEKENGVYLGWIKVSIINTGGIVVHEMGCKKLY